MISDTRLYFDTQIKLIDPDLLEWDEDAFGNNDVSETEAEKYYNLIIGPLTPERESNSHTDSILIQLDIWDSAKQDLSAFDNLYDKAINIKNCIIDPKAIYAVPRNFTDIETQLIEPIEEDTNDNVFKMRLSFIVRNAFKF